MKYHYIAKSANSKTGPIPVTYSQRETCPQSCPHYRADCYAEDYYTRMSWDKVAERGGTLAQLCESVASLPAGQLWRFNVAGDLPGAGEYVDAAALGEIVAANAGRRGFTYTHKKPPKRFTGYSARMTGALPSIYPLMMLGKLMRWPPYLMRP